LSLHRAAAAKKGRSNFPAVGVTMSSPPLHRHRAVKNKLMRPIAVIESAPTQRHPWTAEMIERFVPGLRRLLGYRREWLRADLVAGVLVAAVALPTAIAYSQLVGFTPIVGLYAAILPLVAYALFGTSRQLIVNPSGPNPGYRLA
jgi:hypothetical protein